MSTPTGDSSIPDRRAAERLRARKDRIMVRWEESLRKEVPAAGPAPHLILINTLPAILDKLAEALTPEHPRQSATESSSIATEHGGERSRLTQFRMEDLITEYKLLRQIVFDELEEDAALSPQERKTLNLSLDQTMTEACTGYALVQATLRDQVFAIVAHDLRNPLSAAHTTAKLIERMPKADQVPRWAGRIVESISRVDRMIQDLLDTMRVQTGARLQLHLEECDLVEVVREALEHLPVQHGDRFILQAARPVRGYFGREGIRRAVENLAVNAVNYGAPALPITVTVRQDHGRAVLQVHNHGGPIPVEKQETLFRAFQRTTAAEASGKRGWGLGLAQVRAVAEAHGGSIALESTAELGTTFTIDIPLDARPFVDSPVTAPAN